MGMKKNWISIILATTITAASALPVMADKTKFSDITDEKYAWAVPSIEAMAEAGYITGYTDNTFRPDNSVTRLEVLALFSRALGLKEKVNAPLVEIAKEKYGEVIAEYELEWGEDEIAFLMYRNVLSEDDLETYLAEDKRNEPMPRYEAAIIITKAMGKKPLANAAAELTTEFVDASEIPSNAAGYVANVNTLGIMTGMGEDLFSPKTSVLRSQMAVMLYRTTNITKYTFEEVKLIDVDSDGRTVTYRKGTRNDDIGYSQNTVFTDMGEIVTDKQVTTGVDAIITKSAKTLAFVDTIASIPDAEVKGKFKARATKDDITSITILNEETDEKETYPCDEDIVVTYNNAPGSLTNFKDNDYITLKLVNGKIKNAIGETKEVTISNATIESIDIDDEVTVTISHALEEYDGKVMTLASDATVRKNGADTDFSEIYEGDTVKLVVKYGVIQSVTATSTVKNAEGSIQAIHISARPTIEVKVNGSNETFAVTNDVVITINGEDATLYDFRVGDTVKITLEGKAVTKLSATSAQSSNGKIEGTVTAVNQSYGFIKIAYKTESGYTAEETIYCKDATTKVMTSMGVAKKMSDIKVDQNIIATGTTTNGAFTAKLIVISD